jgi:glycosyltransferase involved in cell wall biosynthesis
MKRLRISVAMAAYNASRFLNDQLDSLAAQTRLPDEFVVCDNASEDDTVERLERFAERAPFPVRIERNERNLGCTKNFEKAIGLCEGDVIALADSDDVWLPEKLAAAESVFLERPEVGAVFSDVAIVDHKLNPLGYQLWEHIGFNENLQKALSEGEGFEILMKRNYATGATLSFRSLYRDMILPIPEVWIHDGWITLLISAVAQLCPLSASLMLYRQHDKNETGERKRPLKDRVALARRRGFNALNPLIDRYEAASQRLSEFDILTEEKRDLLLRKIRHLRFRAGLPDNRLIRAPGILRAVARGDYERYSPGWRAALRDLIV